MHTKRIFSRDEFHSIVEGCKEILRKHGFIQHVILHPDCFISAVFEKNCFGPFGDVLPEAPRDLIPCGLMSRDLNRMTLECAFVFHAHGVDNMRIAESLNRIRAMLLDVLGEMGYRIPSGVSSPSEPPHWPCYWEWEELARKEGMGEKYIVQTREWHHERHPSHYEDRPVAV